jgi:hypothetical protein
MSHDDFLVEDYKLKLGYLTSQFDRLWTRFNYFLTVEMALFGFMGYLVFDKSNIRSVPFVGSIGLTVSALWYVIGAEDRALVEAYRARANVAAKRIAEKWGEELSWYEWEHAAAEIDTRFKSPFSWYWSAISVTRLPVVLPLLLSLVWILVLIFGGMLFTALTQSEGGIAQPPH